MEILQTIWIALTTENIILTKIITSFLMFIELTLSMALFTYILNIKVNKSQKIIYISILSIIFIICLTKQTSSLATIIFILNTSQP